MPEQALDLWPDIGTNEVVTPLAILRRQASLLSQKTNNLLEGDVETHAEGGTFWHSFYIVAPALDHYRYRLFTVKHGVELYPVRYEVGRPPGLSELNSEPEFVEWLKRELSSDNTKRVVNALLAQSKA